MLRSLVPWCTALLMLLVALPAAAVEVGLSVSTRFTRTAMEFRVAPAAGKHLAEEYPALMVVTTYPDAAQDEVVDLAGRVPELITGFALELPDTRPLLVDVELELGLCDQAGVCEPTVVGFQVAVKRKPRASFVETVVLPVMPIMRKPRVAIDPAADDAMVQSPWVHDDLPRALAEAQEKDEPLLLVFKTRWCPPCNQLAIEVLDDPANEVDLAPFVKGVFDADLPASWDAKSRYKVGGYPTLLICTPDGEVAARQVGYEDEAGLLELLEAALLEAAPLASLEAQAVESGDPAAALAVADRFRHLVDRAGAAEWFGKVPSGATVDATVAAEVRAFLATTDPDPAAGAAALEELLLEQALLPAVAPMKQAWWWSELAALREGDEAGQQLAWERAKATAEHLLANQPAAADQAEAWMVLALAAEGMGGEAAAKQAWSGSADALLLQLGGEVVGTDVMQNRGTVMSLVGSLRRAERLEEAMSVAGLAVDTAPDEPTFFLLRAKVAALVPDGDAMAVADAGTAYRLASGDLRLKAADLWAELLAEAGETDEARAVIEGALEDLVLPDDEAIRTHRYAGALRARLDDLPTPEAATDATPDGA